MTLPEFLLARILEDERTALAAALDFEDDRKAEWHELSSGVLDTGDDTWTIGDASITRLSERFDPARVLAECEAKRTLVDWAAPILTNWPGAPVGFRYVSDDGLDVLRLLAQPYARHPDCRDEWKS